MENRRRRFAAWAAAVLVLAILLVFGRVLSFEFLAWDDDRALTANPHVQGLSAENIRWMFTNATYNGMYEPVGWLSYAVVYAAFGLHAPAHHFASFFLHIVNALLVFAILRQLLRQRNAGDADEDWKINLAALAGALLWGLHPLRVEVVAWVGARVHCLMGFFLLTAAWCYLRAVRGEGGLVLKRPLFWVSVLCFGLSLVSYPAGVMLPFALLVLDVYVLDRAKGNWRGFLWLALEKAPYVLVALTGAAASIWGRYHEKLLRPEHAILKFGPLSRVMQAFYVWANYLWGAVFPAKLAPYYGRLAEFDPLEPIFLASALVVIALTVAGFLLRKRWPALWAAWLIHLIVLVPFLGLSQHPHYASDRYTYIEAIAWSALLAGGILALLRGGYGTLARTAVTSLAAIAIFVFAVLAHQQTRHWSDSETFFNYVLSTLDKDRDRATIYWRLAGVYLSQGRLREVSDACDKTIKEFPDVPHAWQHKSYALLRMADQDWHLPLHGESKRLFLEAAAACEQWARLEPQSLGLSLAGCAYMEAGQYVTAQEKLERAVAALPDDPQPHLLLGELLWRRNQQEEAMQQLDRAIALSPELQSSREKTLETWRERATAP